jgi:hypothetical protein
VSPSRLEGKLGSRLYDKKTGRNAQYGLEQQVNWPTTTVGDSRNSARHTTTTGVMHSGTTLVDAVRIWPTPTVQEAGKICNRPNHGQVGLSNHPAIQGACERKRLNKSRAGLPDQERANTIGKSQGQLNPAWVEHLMGLPPGWTQLSIDWIASDSSETE